MCDHIPGRAVDHFSLAQSAQEKGNHHAALRHYTHAVGKDPMNALARQMLGLCIYATEGDLQSARHELEESLRLDASLWESELWLGIVLNRWGSADEAVRERFQRALRKTDQPELVLAVYGEEVLWHGGRYGAAEKAFRKALALEPGMVLARVYYSRMLLCHGRDEEAGALLQEAQQLAPEDRSVLRAQKEHQREVGDRRRDPRALLENAVERDAKYERGAALLRALRERDEGESLG